ncbi:MAG: flavodoxin family protein [Lachnospiraceae bacterium]
MKNLIVYYSYEGNTEELVKGMQQVIDADVLKLTVKDEKPTKSMFRFMWGGMQVYMKKKPELESYRIDLNAYDNIIIGTPCWFGTYAPAVNTFLSDNRISGKNIYLLVCNGGNMRHTWNDFEKTLEGNTIVSKMDLVYPIKNGIAEAKKKVNEWIVGAIR